MIGLKKPIKKLMPLLHMIWVSKIVTVKEWFFKLGTEKSIWMFYTATDHTLSS